MPALTKCPICGRKSDIFAPPTGPFCSVRCKQVDLGNWFTEDYRISDPLQPGDVDPNAAVTGLSPDGAEEE